MKSIAAFIKQEFIIPREIRWWYAYANNYHKLPAKHTFPQTMHLLMLRHRVRVEEQIVNEIVKKITADNE